MKKNLVCMHHLMSARNYQKQKGLICGDFKVIRLILLLQCGYTKNSCLPCLEAADMSNKSVR